MLLRFMECDNILVMSENVIELHVFVLFSYPIASQLSRHKFLCWSLISFLGFGSLIIVEMLLNIVECDNIWRCRKMSLSCTFLSSFMLEQSKSNHDWICADLKLHDFHYSALAGVFINNIGFKWIGAIYKQHLFSMGYWVEDRYSYETWLQTVSY